MRFQIWLYFRDQQQNEISIVAAPKSHVVEEHRPLVFNLMHYNQRSSCPANRLSFCPRIILLILSSCYLAFRVCSLEHQLSFLNPKLPLRER